MSPVAARFVTTVHFVTTVTKHIKFDALPARFVTAARGDKMCRKVHSLHVLSLLRQQHYNLSFPSLIVCVCLCVCVRARTCPFVCARAQVCLRARAHVCVCVLMCVCPWQRACPRVCCCVLCCVYYPRLKQR